VCVAFLSQRLQFRKKDKEKK